MYLKKELETKNWLSIKERLNQCISSTVFKYFDTQYPSYLNKVSAKIPEYGLSLRNSYHKLKQPFCKTSISQNVLSFIDPALWHKIPDEIKRTTNLNTFKHNLKKHYLKGKSSFLKLCVCYFLSNFYFFIKW